MLNTCDGRRRDYPSCGVFYCCRALIVGSLNGCGPGIPQHPGRPGRGKRVQSIALTPSDPEAGSEGSETGDDIFVVNEGAFWRLAGRTSEQRCDRISLMVADTSRNIRPKVLREPGSGLFIALR
jgi:hypothetical protein